MIFVVTGMHPAGFDRLVRIADFAAAQSEEPWIAQIGSSQYHPRNFQTWFRFCSWEIARDHLDRSDTVVTHGGYTAVEAILRGRNVVAVPRRREFHEAIDNHQAEFVDWLVSQGLARTTEKSLELADFVADRSHLTSSRYTRARRALEEKRQRIRTFLRRVISVTSK